METRRKNLNKILYGLRSIDKSAREKSWREIEEIAQFEPSYLYKYRGYLRSLLWNKLQGIREDAWNHLSVYKLLTIEGIGRSLTLSSDKLKITAWLHVIDMINLGIIDKGEVISMREHYWRLLKSYYPTIRKKAWNFFPILVKEGFFLEKDKNRFLEFLKNPKPSIRIKAWQKSILLLNMGFLNKDDIKNNIKYLNELLTKESNIKKIAQNILRGLNI
jgi:hypothetical protein